MPEHVRPGTRDTRALRVPRLHDAVQRGAACVPRGGRSRVFEIQIVTGADVSLGAEPEPNPRRVRVVIEPFEPHRGSQRAVREELAQRVECDGGCEGHASRRAPGVHRRQRRLPVLTKRRDRCRQFAPELRAVELREAVRVDDGPRVHDLRAHGEETGAADALDAVGLEQRPLFRLHGARSVRRARHADGRYARQHGHERGELEVLQHVLLLLLLLLFIGVVAAVHA